MAGQCSCYPDRSGRSYIGLFPQIQEIEATLHCIMSVQEAMDMETTLHLPRLFSAEILGHLPSTGHNRIRRTTLAVIGTFSPSLLSISHCSY